MMSKMDYTVNAPRALELLDVTPNAILLVDRAGMITYVNQAGGYLLGLEPDDRSALSGRTLAASVLGEAASLVEAAFTSGASESGEVVCETEAGALVYAIHARPLGASPGESPEVALFVRDVTKYRRLQDRLRQGKAHFKALLRNAPVAILAVDEAGIITLAEGHGRQHIAAARNDAVGRSIYEVFSDVPAALDNVSRVLKGEEFHSVVEIDARYYEIWSSPLKGDGGSVGRGAIAILTDITERHLAELAVLESEARYRDLFDNTRDLIHFVRQDGSFVFVNPAWKETLGYTDFEIAGLNVLDVIHPDYRDHCREILRMACAGQAVPRFAFAMLSKHGMRIEVEGTISSRIVDGQPISTRAIFRDITAQKHAEVMIRRHQEELERRVAERNRDLSDALASLRYSEAMLSNAQRIARLGSWDWDVTTGIVSCSDESYRIYGLSRDESPPTMETFLSIVHPDDRASLEACLEAALKQQASFDLESRLIRPDGSERIVHELGEVTCDASGKPIRLAGVVQDITERKLAERELIRKSAELMQAKELERLKGDFVNAVSHELRTPLISLKGYAEFLDEEVGGPLSALQRDFLAQIQQNTRRLDRLVDDLLEYARIEAGTFRLRWQVADLSKVVLEAVESFRPQAKAADVQLWVEPLAEAPLLAMDPARVDQVVAIFLSNALKFTPPGGWVHVDIRRGADALRCEVTDSGEGIAPEDQLKLFQRFSQLESGVRKGGTGLGLAISKTIITAHGGEIGVQSEKGAGSTFWFSLPLNLDENGLQSRA
jgi:PAS domain S-box-containing protein